MTERAVTVHTDFDARGRSADNELEELSVAAGLSVSETLRFHQPRPNAAFFLGKGKVEKLQALSRAGRVDVVVFENDLSASQQRNIEEFVGVKTLDRTQLILDIFAQRARSMEGKLQVELAQLKYLLPKLAGKGIFLSRLGGGVGTRGPGEQKLEVDRRRIRERISRLEDKLSQLHARHLAGIQNKREKDFPLLALVGYTHAGKSTLFNRLTHSSSPVRHKLFSTLDTSTRLLPLPANQSALLVDTVGFIRRLPHHLVESFKATLEETVHADLLLHVLDASRPDLSELEESVANVLSDLGALDKKVLRVLNKVDLLSEDQRRLLLSQSQWSQALPVSALTGEGIDLLMSRLSEIMGVGRRAREFFIPRGKLGLVAFLYKEGQVLARTDEATGAHITVSLSPKSEQVFLKRLCARGEQSRTTRGEQGRTTRGEQSRTT